MPGCVRWSVKGLVAEVESAWAAGICAVVLFPKIEEGLKSSDAMECANPDGLVPRVIRAIKSACPGMCVITDVALDPYTSHGQDGLLNDAGYVLNDETVAMLVDQAINQAKVLVTFVAVEVGDD